MVDVSAEMTLERQALMLLGEKIEALEVALLNLSQVLAEKEHGADTVRAAAAAAGKDLPRFRDDPHPYDSLVEWHKSQGAH